jgi:hypothetical protein
LAGEAGRGEWLSNSSTPTRGWPDDRQSGRSAVDGMTIRYESRYRQYVRDRGLGTNETSGSSIGSYLSRLRRVSRTLEEIIAPAFLNCDDDVKRIADRLRGKIPEQAISDCQSAMTIYVAMVQYYQLFPSAGGSTTSD